MSAEKSGRLAGRPSGRKLCTDLSWQKISVLNFLREPPNSDIVDVHLGERFSKYAKSSWLRGILWFYSFAHCTKTIAGLETWDS